MSEAKIIPIKPKKELDPVESLRQNLRMLEDLHQRLRFMLRELEQLVQEDDRG